VNEIVRALVIVGAVAIAVAAAGLWATYRARSPRSTVRTESLRPWPAVVVFMSTDCDACGPVRDAVFGLSPANAFREIAYQGDAQQFRSAGIDKVPAVVVIDEQGIAVGIFEGRVSSRRVGSTLSRAGLG